jgi:hypothetical protein
MMVQIFSPMLQKHFSNVGLAWHFCCMCCFFVTNDGSFFGMFLCDQWGYVAYVAEFCYIDVSKKLQRFLLQPQVFTNSHPTVWKLCYISENGTYIKQCYIWNFIWQWQVFVGDHPCMWKWYGNQTRWC